MTAPSTPRCAARPTAIRRSSRIRNASASTAPADTPSHINFGVGAHICPGKAIALAQVTAILTTVTEKARGVELAGAPTYGHDDRPARYLRLPLRILR